MSQLKDIKLKLNNIIEALSIQALYRISTHKFLDGLNAAMLHDSKLFLQIGIQDTIYNHVVCDNEHLP